MAGWEAMGGQAAEAKCPAYSWSDEAITRRRRVRSRNLPVALYLRMEGCERVRAVCGSGYIGLRALSWGGRSRLRVGGLSVPSVRGHVHFARQQIPARGKELAERSVQAVAQHTA
jgi:hypothetical protein